MPPRFGGTRKGQFASAFYFRPRYGAALPGFTEIRPDAADGQEVVKSVSKRDSRTLSSVIPLWYYCGAQYHNHENAF